MSPLHRRLDCFSSIEITAAKLRSLELSLEAQSAACEAALDQQGFFIIRHQREVAAELLDGINFLIIFAHLPRQAPTKRLLFTILHPATSILKKHSNSYFHAYLMITICPHCQLDDRIRASKPPFCGPNWRGHADPSSMLFHPWRVDSRYMPTYTNIL